MPRLIGCRSRVVVTGVFAVVLATVVTGCGSEAGPDYQAQLSSVQAQESSAAANEKFAADAMLAGSQISRFLILHKELDADDGELTRTRKVRRKFISERYGMLIDALYSDAVDCTIDAQVKFEDGRTGNIRATLKLRDTQIFPLTTA